MHNANKGHLGPDPFPQAILSELMIVRNGNQAHETLVFLRASWLHVDVGRIFVDELGPAFIVTETSIIEMCCDRGRLVGGAFDSRSTRFALGAEPEAVEPVVGGVATFIRG